jgi:hypothetical protein
MSTLWLTHVLIDWLPTHMLVIHVLLLFAVLNPFVLPFGAIYFFVETGVIKNQVSSEKSYCSCFLLASAAHTRLCQKL